VVLFANSIVEHGLYLVQVQSSGLRHEVTDKYDTDNRQRYGRTRHIRALQGVSIGKRVHHTENDELPDGVNQTRIPFLYDIIQTDFTGIFDHLMDINKYI